MQRFANTNHTEVRQIKPKAEQTDEELMRNQSERMSEREGDRGKDSTR